MCSYRAAMLRARQIELWMHVFALFMRFEAARLCFVGKFRQFDTPIHVTRSRTDRLCYLLYLVYTSKRLNWLSHLKQQRQSTGAVFHTRQNGSCWREPLWNARHRSLVKITQTIVILNGQNFEALLRRDRTIQGWLDHVRGCYAPR